MLNFRPYTSVEPSRAEQALKKKTILAIANEGVDVAQLEVDCLTQSISQRHYICMVVAVMARV